MRKVTAETLLRGLTVVGVAVPGGGKDALWSVPAAGGAAIKLVDLSFRPQRMVGSPDDARIAMLPNPGRAVVYVYDIASAKLTARSFASLGVRRLDAVTWLSTTKLLVSGSKSTKGHQVPDL